ncbi:MAG: hypothetical protein AB1824_01250 [Acidobacteriota bacterium]
MSARTSSTRTDSTGSLHPGPSSRGALWLACMAALFLACLLAAQGCAPRRVPLPVVTVCPPIPMPTRPAAPSVVLPAPDAEGRYCLTQRQANDLAHGIRDLQTYAAQVEAAVSLYNASVRHQAAEADRR